MKRRRLQEIIHLQKAVGLRHNQRDIGQTFRVLIEGNSRKSDLDFCGRNTQNKMLVFPKKDGLQPGDYAWVKVRAVSSATLLGDII